MTGAINRRGTAGVRWAEEITNFAIVTGCETDRPSRFDRAGLLSSIAPEGALIVHRQAAVMFARATRATGGAFSKMMSAARGPAFSAAPTDPPIAHCETLKRFVSANSEDAKRTAVINAARASIRKAHAIAAAVACKWLSFFTGYALYTSACFSFAALRFLKPLFSSVVGCPL